MTKTDIIKKCAAYILFSLVLILICFLLFIYFESSQRDAAAEGSTAADVTPYPQIILDPGHGGDIDLGSVRNGLHEKNANLAIALFLKEELISRGYEVFMIRETDEAVENKERPAMALESGADIYVSVHLNSLDEDSDATRGTEVWYSDLKNEESSSSCARALYACIAHSCDICRRWRYSV